jgi:hypothetical protein
MQNLNECANHAGNGTIKKARKPCGCGLNPILEEIGGDGITITSGFPNVCFSFVIPDINSGYVEHSTKRK